MASQPPKPGFSYTGDNLRVAPVPAFGIRYTYNSGSSDYTDSFISILTTAVSYSTGIRVTGNTSTCDPAFGFSYNIISVANYWPLKIGWTNTNWDGTTFTYTTHEQTLDTSVSNFAYQSTASTPYDYKSGFRIWRVV